MAGSWGYHGKQPGTALPRRPDLGSSEGLIFRLGFVAALLALTALAVWVLESTRYALSNTRLLIRSGPWLPDSFR